MEDADFSSDVMDFAQDMDVYASFDQQQQMAVDLALTPRVEGSHDHRSVAIIGVAGCGKTTIIRYIQRQLKRAFAAAGLEKDIVLSATTSMAATLLEATNVYKVFGFVMKYDGKTKTHYPTPDWTKWHIGTLGKRIGNIGALIIDEASMLSAVMLDEIDKMLRVVRRKDDMPFGGTQVILVGDFHQLPPIDTFPTSHIEYAGLKQYLFLSDIWRSVYADSVVHLTHQHRQEGDDRLKDLLTMIRRGRMSKEGELLLRERIRDTPPNAAACVCPTVLQAEGYNSAYLRQLPGEALEFVGRLMMQPDPQKKDLVTASFGNSVGVLNENDLRTKCIVPYRFCVKFGCRVIIAACIDALLFNGAQGVFVGMDNAGNMLVKLDRVDEVCTVKRFTWKLPLRRDGPVLHYENFPVVLGRAITIHKCQGMTLDSVYIDAGCFEEGQFYVACSRVRTLEGLFVSPKFDTDDIIVSPLVTDFYSSLGGLNIRDE
jgi:ATP-dependent DNA helicase PIF1